jgi:hypothetical protein
MSARDLALVRAQPLDSQTPLCECCGKRPASNLHHRQNDGQGGPDTVVNFLALCGTGTTGCHGRITRLREWARVYGYAVWSTESPALVPVAHARLGWVYLLPTGGWHRTDDRPPAWHTAMAAYRIDTTKG